MRQHHSVKLVQRKGFRGVEKWHGVGIRGDVHPDIDHNSRFVGGHVVASTTDFSVRTEGSNPSPGSARTCWAVDVQTEILQQLSSLIAVGLSIHTNVVNRFREERRGSFNLDRPSRFVANRIAVFAPASNRCTWLLALDDDFSITRVKVHLRNVGLLRNNVSNHILCLVHVHH